MLDTRTASKVVHSYRQDSSVGRALWDSGIAQWVEHYRIAQWVEHYGIVE